jgi:hypothetical protein
VRALCCDSIAFLSLCSSQLFVQCGFAAECLGCRAAFYFALTTIATVGYGDITPVTNIERIVAIGFMVCHARLGTMPVSVANADATQRLAREFVADVLVACAVHRPWVLWFPVVSPAAGESHCMDVERCSVSVKDATAAAEEFCCVQLIQSAGSEARRAAIFRDMIMTVEAWMRSEALPNALRHKIRCYFSGALLLLSLQLVLQARFPSMALMHLTSLTRCDGQHADIWVRHEEIDEQKIFAELPFHLRAEVAATLTKKLLKTSHVFSQLSDHDQKSITGLVWARSLAPGHEICRQGDTADCMWILGDGEARAHWMPVLCRVSFAPLPGLRFTSTLLRSVHLHQA